MISYKHNVIPILDHPATNTAEHKQIRERIAKLVEMENQLKTAIELMRPIMQHLKESEDGES